MSDRFATHGIWNVNNLWIAVQIDQLVEITAPGQRLDNDTMSTQHLEYVRAGLRAIPWPLLNPHDEANFRGRSALQKLRVRGIATSGGKPGTSVTAQRRTCFVALWKYA